MEQSGQAGGFSAYSRWLSKATPPVMNQKNAPHSGGVPALFQKENMCARMAETTSWHPSWVRIILWIFGSGGVAFAQPTGYKL
jgi:hypothetical protein